MGSGPSRIKKRFPWGWAILLGLGVLAAAFTLAQRNAPIALAVGRPTVMKAGERNPLHSASGYIEMCIRDMWRIRRCRVRGPSSRRIRRVST